MDAVLKAGAIIEYRGNTPPTIIAPVGALNAGQVAATRTLSDVLSDVLLVQQKQIAAHWDGVLREYAALDEPAALPRPSWYALRFEWDEQPKLFRGRRKWRQRHERIRRLEADVLGIGHTFGDLPWQVYGW